MVSFEPVLKRYHLLRSKTLENTFGFHSDPVLDWKASEVSENVFHTSSSGSHKIKKVSRLNTLMEMLSLPVRSGPKPATTSSLPHSQLDQHGPDNVVQALHKFAFALPGVEDKPSGVSVPGARAMVMHDHAKCNHKAFMVGREFAHIHPSPDSGSLHVQLPKQDALEVIKKGWGEEHYLVTQGHLPVGLVMVFSPRSMNELETVKVIVTRSYDYANGQVDAK